MARALASPRPRRVDARRHGWLLGFAASLLLLVAAAVYFTSSRDGLVGARADLAAASQALGDAQRQHEAASRQVGLAAEARALVADARAIGLAPSDWGERRIHIRQQRMLRESVDELLRSTERDADRLFGAEDFDLSVTHLDEGLFNTPPDDGHPLQLTLRGAQMFRTREARP